MRTPKTASEFLRLGAANANHFYHFRRFSRLELLITPALRRPSRREMVLSCSPGARLCAGPLKSRAGPNTQRLYSTALRRSATSSHISVYPHCTHAALILYYDLQEICAEDGGQPAR